MTHELDPDYQVSTALMTRTLSPVEQLRAALEAAEELERRGVAWENAWKTRADLELVGRVAVLAGCLGEVAMQVVRHGTSARRDRSARLRIVE